jgi:[ribosomal protein S18]-alanine N-acetyltransferase
MEVPELEVRPVTRADLEGITRLEESSFDDPYPEYFLLELVEGCADTFLVAVSQGALVGYAVVDHWSEGEHLVSIAVDEAWRRKGVGQRLLSGLVAKLGSGKLLRLEVRRGNAPAVLFYLKNGFKEVGMEPAYYRDGEDALLMEKLL